MPAISPCLHGFKKLFGGRKPASNVAKLLNGRFPVGVLCSAQLSSLFGGFLPAGLFVAKKHSGPGSRDRIYTPAVTFWAFLGQVMDPGSSCRKAVARLQALFVLHGLAAPSSDTNSYCRARRRLSLRWLKGIHQHITSRLALGQETQGAIVGQQTQGRLLVADGTLLTLPDTPALQRLYPQHTNQKPGCGFPLMKLLALFDLRSGAWLETAHSHKNVHDCRLWRRLFRHFVSGDTIIVDRAFCSWVDLVRLQARGAEVVVRLQSARQADFRKGKRLGKDDHLVTWKKPRRPQWMGQAEYDALPEAITVREVRRHFETKGNRTTHLIVVTTLLDPAKHSANEVAALYARRWRVELNFDDLKTTMHMEMLRTKGPAMICRELVMHMIAYNLMRSLMAQAQISVEKASFKGTVDRLTTWCWAIWLAPTKRQASQRTAEMLRSIAQDEVPHRPGRQEPRSRKRRQKPYDLLTFPRRNFENRPRRSKKRKAA